MNKTKTCKHLAKSAQHLRPSLTTIFACLALFGVAVMGGCADMKSASSSYKQGRYDDAVGQWEKLAEFGEPRAQVSLGRAYVAGKGVEPDAQKAKTLFEQAAAQGEPSAYFELARLHEKGLAVEQNPNKALELYRRSAEMGYARGYYYLAQLQERHGLASPEVIRYNYQCALDRGYDRALDDIERMLEPS